MQIYLCTALNFAVHKGAVHSFIYARLILIISLIFLPAEPQTKPSFEYQSKQEANHLKIYLHTFAKPEVTADHQPKSV